jgi:hypothetical protein
LHTNQYSNDTEVEQARLNQVELIGGERLSELLAEHPMSLDGVVDFLSAGQAMSS